jgi:hypothetical protein
MNRKLHFAVVAAGAALLFLLGSCDGARAADDGPLARDPVDGMPDASKWLLERKGFLPVPIIITEPAIGYGGGLGLLFFRESTFAAADTSTGRRRATPDVFGVAAAATENGTKFGAAGGMFSFGEDRWRYRGGIAQTNVNLDFYGVGGALGTGDRKVGYNIDGIMSSQQLLRRIGESDHFVGVRWIYLDLDSSFDPSRPRPQLPLRSFAQRSSGLGLSWEYDSRDNIFTPSRGVKGGLDSLVYAPAIGSDNEFETYRAHVFAYLPAGKSLVVAGRLDGRAARGDVPFYQMPYIDMRGVPAARYQDTHTAVAETELRWNVTPRWALIGFLGAGRAWGTRQSFDESGTVVTKGTGVRYLIARRLGLYVGADYAWGPEDRTIYIQVGSAWR